MNLIMAEIVENQLRGKTEVKNKEFYERKNLTEIIVPSSIKSIGDHAFWSCSNVTAIEIPSSVTHIGKGVFSGCSKLTAIIAGIIKS